MGAMVSIYKKPLGGDFTNDGISSKAEHLCVVNVPGPFNPNKDMPRALLIKRKAVGNVVVIPCDEDHKPLPGSSMFGGNFAYGDSSFADAVRELSGYPFSFPVAIHDRFER